MGAQTADERGVVVSCRSCDQRNRIPYERLNERGQCGRCQTALPPPSEPVEMTSEALFQRATSSSSLPVLVDYWASWCGPCRMVAPEVAKVAASEAGRLLVVKVNTEALQGLAAREGIQSIPTLAVHAGGREVARQPGALPAEQILAFVRAASTRGAA